MVQKILNKIESKRKSEELIWKFLVFIKDILWHILFFIKTKILYYFLYLLEYPYKKIMRSRIKNYIEKKYTIEFITASHKSDILNKYLLKSKIFEKYKLIVQKNFTNVPKAYNEANSQADIKIYIHHDVYLPNDFEENLLYSIYKIEKKDKNWGVLGVMGVIAISDINIKSYGNLTSGGGYCHYGIKFPQPVDTLDELILITKKKFVFDEKVGNHFYGADICLQAKESGMKNYTIDAFLNHASDTSSLGIAADFWVSRKYIKEKYEHLLPIATTCTIIPKVDNKN